MSQTYDLSQHQDSLPIYFDYMATTPLDPRVKEKMLQYMDCIENFGNPASEHFFGYRAREAVEASRQQVAATINADPREIIFTSGATEANNLALKGAAQFYKRKGKHIITITTEHKAVLDCCAYLETQGYSVTYVNPEKNGLLDLEKLKAAIRKDTILVSVMLVNNEIGVIQDIAAIGSLIKPYGIIFHVDAAQAIGRIVIDLKKLPVDLMSFSAHKVYGPKGIGALFVRHTPRIHLQSQIHGGGQEHGLRSGTLATHQIVGMGKAFAIVNEELEIENTRLLKLRSKLWSGLQEIPGIQLNGDLKKRVASNLHVSFQGVNGEKLYAELQNDLAISSGAACATASVTPSHVLKAIGVSNDLAKSSMRFSLGRFTIEKEIALALEILHFKLKKN